MQLSKTTETTVSLYALRFEKIIKEVRRYADTKDVAAKEKSNGTEACPFADSADLCADKLIQYYKFVDNPLVLVATVLDPKGKSKVYKKTDHPTLYTQKAEQALKNAYEKYYENYGALSDRIATEGLLELSSSLPTTTSDGTDNFYDDLEDVETETEVERYLKDKLAPPKCDVLQWWKQNESQYPVLAKMAKDYLAIQCSSKDTEGGFSKARRQMPYYRHRVSGKNFKAQMLLNSAEALCK